MSSRISAHPVALSAGLAFGVVVSLGLSRFAYSLLLPAMRHDLGWSYSQAGGMNTANAVGYLLGSLVTVGLARRFGTRRTFAAGTAAAAVCLLLAAGTGAYAVQLALRLAVGVAAGLTFVGGGVLVAGLANRTPQRAGLLLNVYVAGAGVGIAVSGLVVEPILGTGSGSWRWAWVALGTLSALSLAAAAPSLRAFEEPAVPTPTDLTVPWWRELWVSAIAYLLFGLGYIAYVTFIVAFLRDKGAGTVGITVFWTLLGLAVLAGVPLWGRLSDRLRSDRSLALIHAVLVVGCLLPLLGGSAAGLASGILFGGSFMAVPAGIAHLARSHLPPAVWSAGIGGLTSVFAVGQIIGPALAGYLSDHSGGTGAGLLLAAGVLAAAALIHLASAPFLTRSNQRGRVAT